MIFDRIVTSEPLRRAHQTLHGSRHVDLHGLWGSAGVLTAAALGRLAGAPVVYLTPHLDDADAAVDDVEIAAGLSAACFPAWEVQLATDHVSEDVTAERIALLSRLLDAPERVDYPDVLVVPVMALLQPVPTPDALRGGRRALHRGDTCDLEELAAWLSDGGYEHVEQVDQRGEFAHRGGIVDVFPPDIDGAVRLEFFGDQLESIRLVDLDSQRSTEPLEAVDLTAMTVGRSLDGDGDRPVTHLLDYLPSDAIVAMLEPAEIRDLATELYDRIRDDLAAGDSPVALRRVEEVFGAMDRFGRADMHLFAGRAGTAGLRLGVRSLQRVSINTAEALEELTELAGENDVWIYCDNAAERDRFAQRLADRHEALARRATLEMGHLATGFHWPDLNLVAVGHHEIYQRYAKVRRIRRVRAGRPIQSLLDLAEGDYVVHVGHGIAKFDGLRRMEREGVQEEFLRLRFADNAVLHVPAGQIQLVQKYIGSRGKRPSLSKLGGKHWSRVKQRVSEAVEDLAAEMLRIQAVRQASPGIAYPVGTEMQRQFAEEFLYTETEDQLAALVQIDRDMAEPRPMDRLICGDVGYGKTELAMRAALKAVEAGKQVGVLVPTTVLADQHLRTFRERFADYPVRVEMLSRFRTASEQAETIHKLSVGQVDICIGTHRLLSKDVRFADLGLAIIDEEQRFGVQHKEHLKSMRAMVDVMTLTATPIPRTLHMALLGLRDISSLQTPPMDRRAIHTEVCPYDDELIRTAVLRELNRGGQVFYVHNRVQNIESIAKHIQSLVPEARIAIGHGQMKERSLEKVMLRFLRGDIDVLVCTTIIESGLDIQTANTMIIHDADRFGLAELHQLRGRVGRYKHRAYCYLLLPQRRPLTPVAAKRLKAIEDFSDLGAGFQIAMRDLEIRGAGNILGPEQSGHIAMVGYELYCQLLEQAVQRMRGEAPPESIDVHVELGIDVYIPRSYVPADRQRMEIYRRLVHCTTIEEVDRIGADLADAYGRLPELVDTLLEIARLRVLAHRADIQSILLDPPDVVFRVGTPQKVQALFADAQGSVRMPDARTIHWRPPEGYLEMPTLLRVLLRRLAGDKPKARQAESKRGKPRGAVSASPRRTYNRRP